MGQSGICVVADEEEAGRLDRRKHATLLSGKSQGAEKPKLDTSASGNVEQQRNDIIFPTIFFHPAKPYIDFTFCPSRFLNRHESSLYPEEIKDQLDLFIEQLCYRYQGRWRPPGFLLKWLHLMVGDHFLFD